MDLRIPQKEIPRGRILIELHQGKLPKAEMSGKVEINDVTFAILAIRKAYVEYLNKIGAANKAAQAEKERVAKTETDRQGSNP